MDNAVAAVPPLDLREHLARINHRIALLRSWISHHHGDEPYWWARRTTAPRAQAERETLRHIANVLHVERASSRGRLHGTRFATIDEQRVWLAQQSTLALLREGKLQL